jgi:uncharacterized protein
VRSDVEFDAAGTTLRGYLYVPDEGETPFPVVVMCHGFSGVKELLIPFAERFVAAGLAVLLYDHRNTGTSDGLPRQDIDPVAQIRDMRHAITWCQLQGQLDADRIGIWGTSYSGGHVLAVAASDRRVKCVVSQVPLVKGIDNLQRALPNEAYPAFLAQLDAARVAEYQGGAPATMPVSSADPATPSAFPGARTWFYLTGQARSEAAATWRNEVTVRSIDHILGYDVSPFVPHISPTPLLLLVASVDISTPADLALSTYLTALEPKKVVVLPDDHYSPYMEDFEQASTAATEWLGEHLLKPVSKPLPTA